MTRASKKTEAQGATRVDVLAAFDALMTTADVESGVKALADGGADTTTLDAELTRLLRLAHDRWGLGLQHLTHDARVHRDGDTVDVALHADGREIARVSTGAAAVSAAYETMRALGADDLSEWGVLPDGHRVTRTAGSGQMRVLVEDARDFETLWTAERGGAWTRTWRSGDTLAVEAHRPASPQTALADAAWDAITSIRNRQLQRELMERSNSVGMLGALLAARHSGAERALERLPEAHFTVRSAVVRAAGREGRDYDRWKAMVREATEQLEEHQKATTGRVAEILRHGLR
ncbi:hypothetical protein [Deinococcus pimensis]|uniref:hypothetical protein n=1 Tax=Deinococcus pimensis TaxID=309888 RepID=UPI0004877448|nr:hypothetical protein [Deinococcus pimensis]